MYESCWKYWQYAIRILDYSAKFQPTYFAPLLMPSFLTVLRCHINFMRLQLRVKILMWLRPRRLRLWLLTYCIARQNFKNKLKFKYMLKLSCSYDSVRFLLLKIWTEWVINCYILSHFSIPIHVQHHCKRRSCRSQSPSHIMLRLRLWLQPNDAAPCSSGSGSSSATLCSKIHYKIGNAAGEEGSSIVSCHSLTLSTSVLTEHVQHSILWEWLSNIWPTNKT
jgi:hypothetical protein